MNVTAAPYGSASTLAEFVGFDDDVRMDKTDVTMNVDLDVSPVTLSSAWSRVARLLLLASLAVGGSVGNVFMISAVVVEDQLKKRVPPDGTCLFHCIAFSMSNYIDIQRASKIREKIVEYISNNWMDLSEWTCNKNGDPYNSVEEYRESMLNTTAYGSTIELKAAGDLRKLNKLVAVAATTGIAAFNIDGMTIHRLLQLPVEHGNCPKYTSVPDQVLKVLRSDLNNLILLIIHEVSMISNVALMYIHLRLTEIYDTGDVEDGWFGRINIVLFGDLLQLPPVRQFSPFENMQSPEIIKFLGSLGAPNTWKDLLSYDELTINMRQKMINSSPKY
ncbi:hypothetical protein KPH14_008885 [Odynerus spinipes]|uniref:ATP-dependent DNA helicase n=1 Tax=Odynerus spinipes TaxID=1348599 RepID=A0AAD9RGT7_9HYME|nr:hypothetical protein KPH14_008885 [Odynerus spinipes]